MTDAFTKFSQAIITNSQKALSFAKILVDKLFDVYGIPVQIHSDKGCSFDDILSNLYSMYNIKQSMTKPCNPHGASQCDRFNCTLLDLLKTLLKEQKANWPLHVHHFKGSLIMVMPHNITGFYPYELMFRCEAPTVCDAWLVLASNNVSTSTSTCAWVNEQQKLVMNANRWMVKHINQSAKKSQTRAAGKPLHIMVGSLVLLRDHLEGWNKTQDNYKSKLFVGPRCICDSVHKQKGARMDDQQVAIV